MESDWNETASSDMKRDGVFFAIFWSRFRWMFNASIKSARVARVFA